MTYGSLFAGIGGIDLGLDRAGWQCRWQIEIDPFCRQVLEKHWPHVKRYADIRKVQGEELEPVDLLAGGFPCQDLSQAGKRAGIEASRSGLWFEFARVIGQLRPRLVSIENVSGLLVHDAMRRVVGELARLGYVGLWLCLRASDFGAPVTGANESSSWPSPVAQQVRSSTRKPGTGGTILSELASNWPTANNAVHGPDLARANKQRDCGGNDLETMASRLWTTPQAHDAVGARPLHRIANHREKTGAGARNLSEDVSTWKPPHGMSYRDSRGKLGGCGGEFAKQAHQWQTPATDSFRARGGKRKDEMGLDQQARFFPTPAARDYRVPNKKSYRERSNNTKGEQLQNYVEHHLPLLPAPATPAGPPSSPSTPTSRRRLNPQFVEWLMGFPIGWTELSTER